MKRVLTGLLIVAGLIRSKGPGRPTVKHVCSLCVLVASTSPLLILTGCYYLEPAVQRDPAVSARDVLLDVTDLPAGWRARDVDTIPSLRQTTTADIRPTGATAVRWSTTGVLPARFTVAG
jgi:hypothetical protein